MAKRTSTELVVDPEYMARAQRAMEIDMDNQGGLFCLVPSQKKNGGLYTVHLDDSLLIPVVVECSCTAWEHYHRCRHAMVVSAFFKRIYRSNIEKIEAKKSESTYWDKDQCCQCYIATRKPVDPVAQEAKLKAQVEAYKDEMLSVPLNGNREFAIGA